MIKHVTEEETRLANMLRTCSEALEATTKERDALALDAARYRWIVCNIVEDTMEVIEDAFAVFGDALGCTKAGFDAAIDAAIRSGEDK